MIRKVKILLNKYLPQKLDPTDIKSFKVMIKHINSNGIDIVTTPSGDEFIASNPRTHYDLIINDTQIQLVNTKDIIDLSVSYIVKDRVISRIRKQMYKERQARVSNILARKENTLDKILTYMV